MEQVGWNCKCLEVLSINSYICISTEKSMTKSLFPHLVHTLEEKKSILLIWFRKNRIKMVKLTDFWKHRKKLIEKYFYPQISVVCHF